MQFCSLWHLWAITGELVVLMKRDIIRAVGRIRECVPQEEVAWVMAMRSLRARRVKMSG